MEQAPRATFAPMRRAAPDMPHPRARRSGSLYSRRRYCADTIPWHGETEQPRSAAVQPCCSPPAPCPPGRRCRRGLPPLLLRRPRRAQRLADAAVPRPPVGMRACCATIPQRASGAGDPVAKGRRGGGVSTGWAEGEGEVEEAPRRLPARRALQRVKNTPTPLPAPHLHRRLPAPSPAAGPPSPPRLAQQTTPVCASSSLAEERTSSSSAAM